MSKNKSCIIVITTKNPNSKCGFKEIFNFLGLEDGNKFNEDDKPICGFDFSNIKGFNDIDSNFNADFVFVFDGDINTEIQEKLARLTVNSNSIYCIYHKGTDLEYKVSQRNAIAQISTNKLLFEIEQSHVTGSIYCEELIEIAKARSEKNAIKYLETIIQITANKEFVNSKLEHNLFLLNDLLTIEGFNKHTKEIEEYLTEFKMGFSTENLSQLNFDEELYQKFLNEFSDKILSDNLS
jgi:hypothetical protein